MHRRVRHRNYRTQEAMDIVPATTQLALPFTHSEDSLRLYLEARLLKPVRVVLTSNSTSMLSAKLQDGTLRIRLHRMFLLAENRVLDEIGSYLKNKKGAMPGFRSFIRANKEQLCQKPPKKAVLRPAGRFHDLSGLYDEINKEYFGGMVNAAITWGTGSPRYRVRKRTLGSYSTRSHRIRINPVLDRKTVPRYYVAFIVYHEMLHAAMGISVKGQRRSIHPREFREREKLFKDFDKARAWEG